MNSAARSEALVPKALELLHYEKRSNSFANANPVLVIDKFHPSDCLFLIRHKFVLLFNVTFAFSIVTKRVFF
jgi:hypothetical protein